MDNANQNLKINHDSNIPYYVQVKDALRNCIARGDWGIGDQVPGEMELCNLFSVSRTVIRQALDDLMHEGLIRKVKGKGTFIAEPKINQGLVQELTGFYQDMTRRGRKPHTQVLAHELIPARSTAAKYLQINPGDPVIHINRLRFVDSQPVVVVRTYIPQALCPELLDINLTNRSLYAFLESKGLIIVKSYRSVEAVLSDEQESELLGIPKGSPLLQLHSVSYLENGMPLEYYRARHRGDLSKFEVELHRGSTSLL
jgi:GntR family transcriptional regulator